MKSHFQGRLCDERKGLLRDKETFGSKFIGKRSNFVTTNCDQIGSNDEQILLWSGDDLAMPFIWCFLTFEPKFEFD